MTAYLAGLAIVRCKEHPRADEIRGTARLVLASMAWFAKTTDDPPVCVASQDDIASTAGVSIRTVHEAQGSLERLGLIVRAGAGARPKNWRPGFRFTVRWHLSLLSSADSAEEQSVARAGQRSSEESAEERAVGRTGSQRVRPTVLPAKSAEEQSAKSAEEQSAESAEYPSDSSRPLGREEGGSDAHAPAPSAGAPGLAPAPSNGPLAGDAISALVREVMAARGDSAEQAQKWIDRRLAASDRPVRNEKAFIRGCLANEAAAKTAKPAKKTAPKKAAAKKAEPAARQTEPPSTPGSSVTLLLMCEATGHEQSATRPAGSVVAAIDPLGPDVATSWGSLRPGRDIRGVDQRVWTVVSRG
ncbi:helix-turn-helix domain-containing protein [Asanoa iriomotensis]|uniref:Helix-turn-helix domain-containing protein n=1 Tax=Asanoa iriomotensis TaxID=234613 RepID=A0ABQ4CAQ5_9ACTN|nr:helix-turn-helix domain-containing protein [Asanoa iriomotensis]GIF59834.1 hypothetical protein Air01nite_59290 [Asanoa iriomotensis]